MHAHTAPRWSRRQSLLHLAAAGWAWGAGASAQTPPAPSASAAQTVVYPNLNGKGQENLGYKMLELALSKSGKSFALVQHATPVNNERARTLLRQGEVDVADFGSGAEHEKTFRAIYFPIDRGLLSYRVSLIHANQEATFAKVNTLQQLRNFRAGQGLGWSGITVLQAAGIPVVTVPTLESLFPMLEARRFDFLPLGLSEVYGLAEQYGDFAPSAMVDSHLVIVFRMARLLFVRHESTELHAAILLGLKRAFADGAFHRVLYNDPSVRRALLRARLSQRSTIVLDNPLLTEAFLAMPDEYFFKPAEFK